MVSFHCIRAIFALSILVISTLAQAEPECAVDERMNIALNIDSVVLPSKVLLRTENVSSENDCYRSCCKLIQNGDECNAASFLIVGKAFLCINAKCSPFSSCEFIESPFALAAKVAVFDSSVNFDESEEPNTSQESNGTMTGNATGSENMNEEEVEEEIEELFDSKDVNDTWNIEYENYDYSTSTLGYYDYNSESQGSNTSGGEGGDDALKEGDSQWNTDTNGDESSTGGGEVNTVQDAGETDEDLPGDVEVIKPHLTHGNSGIYGPSEVTDFDYSSTPVIVIGVVVTVLFLLLLLVFVGRKMMHNDRLKYRPLRDSFPAANAYHDLEQ